MNIAGALITASKTVKLLGVQIDHELKFDSYIESLSDRKRKTEMFSPYKESYRYHQAKLLCNSFILSQFNYCPLIWMFMNKTLI